LRQISIKYNLLLFDLEIIHFLILTDLIDSGEKRRPP
jgi:hypothetical protein